MKALAVLLMLAAASPARGQFLLYLVNGNTQQPVGRSYDFGNVEPGGSLTVTFRIQNASAAAAILDLLSVNGAGFSLAAGSQPSLPLSLAPQKSLDFGVVFQPAGTGNYSAALDAVGISTILTAEVPAELTAQLETAGGTVPLAAGPVNFGSVERGSSATVHVLLVNQTDAPLLAPGPVVTGAGFVMSGPSPAGILVQPVASVAFDLQFSPAADGTASGQLSLGTRAYQLLGTGVDPPLPQPRLSVTLAQAESAQQGTVAVSLQAPAATGGTGTVTLSFAPAPGLASSVTDSGMAFASGGQSAAFTVSAGDTQGHFGAQLGMPFQTGTTAGTLTLTVQLGNSTNQQTIAILPAVVDVTAAQAVRSTSTVEVDLTGFDNTRSVGALAFTFFDARGTALGAVNADGAPAFASYFRNAADGTFALKAVFPVVGDPTQIKTFQATVTNSAGLATTPRTSF